MIRHVLLAGLVLFGLLACGGTPPEPTPFATLPPTNLPVPSVVPAASPTPRPVEVSMRVTAELVNCRFGPGTVYQLVSEIPQGKSLRAVGRNETDSWWYVKDPGNPNGLCWVSAEVVDEDDGVEDLPVLPPPFVTVTNVDLRVEPNRIVVNCSQFPQTVFFEALVTTNGPTLLTWKWEASTGAVSDVGTLIYEQAGTQAINEFYQVNAPNEYWVKLHVLTPNELTQQISFPVSCTP
ncbi:MAG TPA: hypothetical protein PK152_12530 [Anaerolineales bacterium]|nr:hypothetical protein [Anaerolineales bacterium]